MRLHLQELQEKDNFAQKIRADKFRDRWEDLKRVFQYDSLPFVPDIIRSKVISRHHNNLLVIYFGINKTQELISWKYYWLGIKKDVKFYIKGCDVCLALKTVSHKLYNNL